MLTSFAIKEAKGGSDTCPYGLDRRPDETNWRDT